MCIFANEGGPKSKSSRKETPLKIQKYKEKHVSGKNLEKKMFSGMSAPTPNQHACILLWGMHVYKLHGCFVQSNNFSCPNNECQGEGRLS